MIGETDSEDRDPWSGTDDPLTIGAIGAELERIVGASASPGPDASGVNWALPMVSFDELLVFLRRIPSGIGMEGLEAQLRDRIGARLTSDAAPPGQSSEGGA
jgi:hypothetical protein